MEVGSHIPSQSYQDSQLSGFRSPPKFGKWTLGCQAFALSSQNDTTLLQNTLTLQVEYNPCIKDSPLNWIC